MANEEQYISQYAGEEIDNGVIKANNSLQLPTEIPEIKELVGIGVNGEQIKIQIGNGLEFEGTESPFVLKLSSQGLTYNDIYPIDSIYETTNGNFNPNNKFGGTWELIKDKFLLGAGNLYNGGDTGGETTHTLTLQEIPSHNHGVNSNTSYWGDGSNTNTCGKGGTASVLGTTSAGGGQAHNNMPPYLAVYIWKRVA